MSRMRAHRATSAVDSSTNAAFVLTAFGTITTVFHDRLALLAARKPEGERGPGVGLGLAPPRDLGESCVFFARTSAVAAALLRW